MILIIDHSKKTLPDWKIHDGEPPRSVEWALQQMAWPFASRLPPSPAQLPSACARSLADNR